MARRLRIQYPGALYHITSRGNAKQTIFVDDEDKRLFLRLLARTVREHEWSCYSYCLMSNHYHLLIETPKANLSCGMHLLNSTYAHKHNQRHNRVGHLLQGRFHAVIVDKEEYLLEVCRYIVLNPVRAGLVNDPVEYPWSSYLEIIGRRKARSFLDTAYVRSLFSQPGRFATEEYRAFVLAGLGRDIWSNLRGGLILGNDEFATQIQERIGTANIPKGVSRLERYAGRPELSAIFDGAHESKYKRNARILDAYINNGYSQREIAKHLGLNHSTICKVIGELNKENSSFRA